MNQQQFDATQKLLETLSANVTAGVLLVCLVISGAVFVFAYTRYKQQQGENKKAETSDLVIQRVIELEQRAQNELLRQRDVNEKQRVIIDDQQKTAIAHATAAQEALKALEAHNKIMAEGNRMAEERGEKLRDDMLNVKINLASGVSIAEENNTLAKENVALARDTHEAIKVIDSKLDKLPDTTAQAVANTLEPIQDEFESVSEKLQGLTNVVKEQPDLAGKVDTLILQMTEVQQTLKEIREAVKPPKNETPTLPSKPVE